MSNILLTYYSGNPSYVESLGSSYFVLSFTLLSVAIFLLITDPTYFQVIFGKLLYNPNNHRAKDKKLTKSLPRMAQTTSQFLFSGSLALVILMVMKPYDYITDHSTSFLYSNNYFIWILLTVVFLVIYNIKSLHYLFDNWLTENELNIAFWGKNILNINFLSAFVLIPLSILYALGYLTSPTLGNLLLMVCIGNLVLRAVTTIPMWMNFNSSNKINFFLYFCTFELLPLLILIKFIKESIF